MARCAAAMTGAGVGKSGSPISMWITLRPAASSARAAVWTSMTWNGAISATRAASRVRDSIGGLRSGGTAKRYRSVTRRPREAMFPVRLFLPCAALALGPAAPGAHATVYKCLLDDGRTFYQDLPCPPGRELRDFDKDPANVSVVPFAVPAAAAPSAGKASRAAPPKPRGGNAGGKVSASGAVPKPDSRPARKAAER